MELKFYEIIFFFAISASLFHIQTAQTVVSEVTFTYDGTDFSFVETEVINQPVAQTQCVNWGGSLATIESAVEDSLLFYSIPDLSTTFTCYIGLNKIGGGDFAWKDSSTSSYRNWGTLLFKFPLATNGYDCVRHRYRSGGVLSQGWLNDACSLTRNCYFCSKSGTSNGCDLIYDSSCYKVFEVSNPINWLDAQSSCAIWGGDLTSITTVRENNYLNTLITSSVGNCWIGLNDRDVDGMYTWIDGTTVGYTNWTSTPSDDTNSNCVQINNAGNGMWESVSCGMTLSAFLCKRDSSSIIPTVGRFGRITNGAYEFEELTVNTFLFGPQTLVCGSDGSPVVWEYSQNSDLSVASIQPETSNLVDFSLLEVVNTMQGYYLCVISNSISFTVGVYDTTSTTVAVAGTSYTYIVGVDRTDVLLLCNPVVSGSLSTLIWSLQGGMNFNNPIYLNSESSNLPDVSTSLSCVRDGTTIVTTQICVKVPTISISYGVVPVTTYSSVYPAMDTLSVPSAVQDITLSINIEGKWTLPDSTESTNSILTIPDFSLQNNGVYKFYINNWDGVEVCAIQITLTTTTTITGTPDNQLTYDNTEFGYFSESLDWYAAQLQCLDWGGNLATIKSKEEDSLLYYTTDITTHYGCYIGLNDILNEADSNADAFTWIDGSSSAYRNFQPGLPRSGSGSDDRDCVNFRYKIGNGLSEGWIEPVCTNPFNCHFCTKPATSGDCDLIHEGSCYKVFEVSTPINWLDAQSSCAIWGGDLTSITTERENNYLNTLITSSVGNCWIGLNDRDVEGMYTWIDGTTFTSPNFISIQSNEKTNDCVEIDTTGNSWVSVNCDTARDKFLCERDSTVTTEPIFIVLTNGVVLYRPLSSDIFLYNPTLTLVYGIGDFNGLVWKYATKYDLSDAITISSSFTSSEIEFTSLTIDNSMQGYYFYEINSVLSPIIGLYDDSITTVAVEGTTYTYISGVDRQTVLLLCDPMDGGSLDLIWDNTLTNPVNIDSELSQFQAEPTAFVCTRDTTTIVTTYISVIIPEISVKYYQFLSSSHTDTYPTTNEVTIPLSTQEVSLSTNLVGKWNIPGDTNMSNSVDIGTFIEADNGLYTFYTNNWDGVEVIAMQITISSSPALTAMTPEEEFIFDDTRFGYFSDSPNTNWLNAQLNCISWGGNLATIKSKEEDSLLYYTTDIQTHYRCYIGLNDILNEADNDESAFTWVDGSSSAYRNFQQGFPRSDLSSDDRDCVIFRFNKTGNVLSEGWVEPVCSNSFNCHFCTKPATSGNCDLIYEGSCYKVFEVSNPINWLDAQSSCAIWGGDLTSITTERENNYLNIIIPDTMSNCWIGLNDRDGEGTYTWIDGTTFTQPSFVSTLSNNEENDCVQIINDADWETVSCITTLSTFICKASSVISTVERFGELMNEGLNFQTINANAFLFNSLTLACGGEEDDMITWRFSLNSNLTSHEVLTATYSGMGSGLSWLKVDNIKQGYYQCQTSSSSYTVGVYDTSVTTVAVSGTTYTYLEGIDRDDILLLCDPMDSDTLSTLMWDSTYSNPLNIHSVRNSLPTESTEFTCSRGTTPIVSIFLSVTVPTLVVKYELFVAGSYPLIYSSINNLSIPLETQSVSLVMNIVGKWSTPNGTNSTDSIFQISELMNRNVGVYTFYANNWDDLEVGIPINIIAVPAIEVPVATVSFIFDGTQFGYFTLPTDSINWVDSETSCTKWNGHLATIRSQQEDTLLLHSIESIEQVVCYIGLNDRDSEAGTDADAFVWEDGSNSTYRQFGTNLDLTFPVGVNDGDDCVRFRYVINNTISNGWLNRGCDDLKSCYFCNKPVTPSNCDLIYDSSCYKVFEVSTPINWLDAQSSCAIWGGDLTSITTERENNYLNTLITSSVGNCWIGLNDRDVEGMYTWIDGTTFSHPSFVATLSNNEANDCVQIINDANWVSASCASALTSFICKAFTVISTVERFGELINEGLNFQPIGTNTFLFNSLTLACGGQEGTSISWTFSKIPDIATFEEITATSSSSETGLSWLDVDISKQGYYQCQIGGGIKYILGLYNQTITTVAVSGTTYSYTVGIDRVDASLLCDPNDDSIYLGALMWGIVNGGTLMNPINMSEWSNTLAQQTYQLNCPSAGNEIITVTTNIYVPTLTVSFTESSDEFSALYPASNTIPLKVRTEDFSLSANLPGRWKLPDDTDRSGLSISYASLDYEYFGLYQYLINNWDGNEVVAIQITLIPDGFVVTYPISISGVPIQNDSIIFVTQDGSMIDCAVSNLSDTLQWTFKFDTVTDITSLATFSEETGFSTLVVTANEPGDYSCIINRQSVYTFSVLDTNSIVMVESFNDPLQQVNFTVDSPMSLLYYPSSSITQDSVSDSDIHWTNDVVVSGEDKEYSQYPNPADLKTVFSNAGGGVQTFSCFYKMSPVTLVGSVQLALKDTATITVNYPGSSIMTFSDANNPIFPSAQKISILVGTTDVMLTCSLSECIWMVSNEASVITMQIYTIPAINDSYNADISLMRMTDTGVAYTTAHISIISMSTESPPQSLVPIIAGIVIVILLLAVVAVAFTIILVYFWVRKRGKSNKDNSKMYNSDAKSTSSEIPLKHSNVQQYKDDIPLQDVNPVFMPEATITKPKIHPHSPVKDSFYQNISDIQNIARIDSPIIKQVATPVVDPRTQLIPLDIFKTHMNKIWQRENALQEEYDSLGGKDHRYPCTHAKIEENKVKNRFKLMYPYDTSRVVLSMDPNGDPNSDYVNASRIPGVYVKEKFIGAQAPKENTLIDFWKMVVESKVVNIVMVTNIVESGRKKCEQYFPLKVGQKVEFGPYEIVADEQQMKIGYTIKELSISHMGKTTKLRHFHFTAWPDHDVPTLYDELLLFVSKVQEGRIKTRAPILVHCSAGVGRTGTFITLYNLWAAIQQTKPISIYNVVNAMREHRPQMVQTYSQYKFIYLSVLEMLLGNTSIPTEEFIDTFGLYMQSEHEGYVSVFFQQYSELNYQCEKGFDPICSSALNPANENKNPVKDILPCDSNRVVLESSHWPGDYINATSLDNSEIILTINPTGDTVRDFNQLIYMVEPSLVVMLCSNKELQQIEQGKSHRVVYWPKHGETLQIGSFSVTCPKSDKGPHFIRNKLNIHHDIDNHNRPFTQIISNQWNDREEPNLENVITLIKTILEFRKRDPAHPVIIHCDDGAGKSGVVYTVYKVIKDSTEKGVIDIFHIVKKLRNERMNSVTTLTHFVSCFTLMNEYCSKSQ